jgi:TM2 domain-containing membrane protein YozV
LLQALVNGLGIIYDFTLEEHSMKRILRENGLSFVWLGLFFFTFIIGQSVSGYRIYNNDQREHQQPQISYAEYLTTPHFVEATMENWESEFLQMFLFVLLTAFLYQKGSAESKKLDEKEPVDRDPRLAKDKRQAPWPVRKGGIVLRLYEHSLSLAFLILFIICFFLHAAGGAREYNQDRIEHGSTEQVSTFQYISTSRFWFESFQNWQSEFLAVGLMVVFSIWLRQRGSPESKPVDAPHSQTGKD